ncbi:MAG: lysophospholipid acyltransferase family protein, partial [Emcibacter sp.]|nr:lysophospholipid acyltransferase family protein [Emcibacter sp.]
MQRTVFNTPVIRHFFVGISWVAFKVSGWKLEGSLPKDPKYVLIGAPHTSNWDFPLALATAFLIRLDFYWMGKDALFKGLLGPIMRCFGGLPIDRSKSNNVVQSTIDAFNRHDRLTVVIAPEGTRAKVKEWKRGFYHIAHGAKIPIGRAFLDYDRKTVGFGPLFHPTGDVEKD